MHPICFHIGARPIYWYGVMMAAAFLAAVLHWNRLALRLGRPKGYGYDLACWLMLAGIFGARMNYVLANWSDFSGSPWRILRIDEGGLIFYGGFVGAALALVVFARQRGERLWWVADFAVTALPLGHAIGRVGCFLNGCCYGAVGNACLCYELDGVVRHPVQLYESAWNLVVYAILMKFLLRRKWEGTVFCLYLLLYPAGRFVLEFWRGDIRQKIGCLTIAQVMSLVLILVGALLSLYLVRKKAEACQTAGPCVRSGK